MIFSIYSAKGVGQKGQTKNNDEFSISVKKIDMFIKASKVVDS